MAWHGLTCCVCSVFHHFKFMLITKYRKQMISQPRTYYILIRQRRTHSHTVAGITARKNVQYHVGIFNTSWINICGPLFTFPVSRSTTPSSALLLLLLLFGGLLIWRQWWRRRMLEKFFSFSLSWVFINILWLFVASMLGGTNILSFIFVNGVTPIAYTPHSELFSWNVNSQRYFEY